MKQLVTILSLSTSLAACTQNAEPRVSDVARAVCPQPGLFEHAVCVCEDLTQVGDLHVKAGPAGIGSVGVNGRTDLVNEADVVGNWIAWGGFSGVGVSIGDSLITPADVDIVGEARIANDLVIGGDLTAVGTLNVGTLRLQGSDEVTGESTIGTRAPYQGAGAAAPCGCDESTFFDVKTAVLAAKQANDGEPSWDFIGEHELKLTTGSYYVTSAQVVGDATFHIEGSVSIFVDGSLASVGSSQWQLAPGATLDLFVSGSVEHVGSLAAGDGASPGAFRLYVGGDDTATIGEVAFFGSLSAPRARVLYVGDARVVGSIFAKSVESIGSLTVEYGTPLTPPQSCSEPPSPDSPEPVLL
jgi:hypothetical protein